MEALFGILIMASCFMLGMWAGPYINKWLPKKRRTALPQAPDKPKNQFSDNYTVEELEKHRDHLVKEFKSAVHYPTLRRSYAEDLKEVLTMLEWYYDTDGTRELRAQRERNQRELAEFDQKYAAALRGIG